MKQRQSARGNSFEAIERSRQTTFFQAQFPGKCGYKNMAFRLQPKHKALNLSPTIRDKTISYFRDKQISWHTHANHALSSQVCCLNFLMPLAEDPETLSTVVGDALNIPPPTMLMVENGSDGRPLFVGFEWNGRDDYLNEATAKGGRTRGANSTSTDAVVRFRQDGHDETVLIEWKYTESYGQPITASGNPTRLKRYHDLVFAPDGPVRNDLGIKLEEFFYEPFYQLLRQQMLAFQMQKAKEDGSDRVRVLHIAPAANLALRKVTSPALSRFGDDAFTVFRSLLVLPEAFISRSTEGLFGLLVMSLKDGVDWAAYLAQRYTFLTPSG